jgi:hypothetical protein
MLRLWGGRKALFLTEHKQESRRVSGARLLERSVNAAQENMNFTSLYSNCTIVLHGQQAVFFFFFFLLPSQVSELSITGRDQTGYTVYAGYCMFPQFCDLRTETAGSL